LIEALACPIKEVRWVRSHRMCSFTRATQTKGLHTFGFRLLKLSS
jgi:hypothetical protein